MEKINNLNHEEEKAVAELKMRVQDDLTPTMREDCSLFYRYLKARDFDIDKAEKFLRKNITWRRIYQADTILQDFKPNEFFEKCVEPDLIGYDKNGDMILYSPIGSFSIFEVYRSMKFNNFIKHCVWFSEKHIALLEEHNKNTGNCRYQAAAIIDLRNLTLKTATSRLSVTLFLRFIQLLQENYPERLKFIYVINVPSYYIYAYSILKTVLASTTVKKIHIFERDGWKESLLKFIDADVLPAFLGGNRTDPDGNPLCRSFIKPGGKIPEKFFLADKDRYFQNGTQIKKIILSNQEMKEIDVDVEEAGFLLQWEFFVRNKDIGFGVYFKNSENEIQEVIPVQRYNTLDGTEKGSYKCHLPGTYIIIFDNLYSWVTSKTVEYSISVTKPSTEV